MNQQQHQALVTALRFLAASPKSHKLLEQKLVGKGYPQVIVERTLDRLEKEGWLNDRAFAHSLFESLLSRRVSGRKRIAFELKKRGIASSLIEELLSKYSFEEEREKALELARERQERWKNLEEMKRRKKIYDFLVRRGFEFSLCKEVVDEVRHEIRSP